MPWLRHQRSVLLTVLILFQAKVGQIRPPGGSFSLPLLGLSRFTCSSVYSASPAPPGTPQSSSNAPLGFLDWPPNHRAAPRYRGSCGGLSSCKPSGYPRLGTLVSIGSSSGTKTIARSALRRLPFLPTRDLAQWLLISFYSVNSVDTCPWQLLFFPYGRCREA